MSPRPPVEVVPPPWSHRMRCCKCDRELPDDAKFCSKCRTPQTSEPAHGSTKPCVACGEPLRPSARFCSKCAAPQAAADAPPPSVPETEPDRCFACGHFLAAEDAACGNCSAPRPLRASGEAAAAPKPVEEAVRGAVLPPDLARYEYLWSPEWDATCPTCRLRWGPKDIACKVCNTHNLWAFNNRWEFYEEGSWSLELRCINCRNSTTVVTCLAPHRIPISGKYLVTAWSSPNPLFYNPYMALIHVVYFILCVGTLFVFPVFFSEQVRRRLLPWARTLGHKMFPHTKTVRYHLADPLQRFSYARPIRERPWV